MPAPAIIARQIETSQILERFMAGEKMTAIAESLGVAKQSLSDHLIRHDEEGWRRVQVACALAELDDAKDEVDAAQTMTDVARCNLKVKQAQWTLEKLFRRLFGQDAQIAINLTEQRTTDQLLEQLAGMLERKGKVIDAQQQSRLTNPDGNDHSK